MKQDVENWLEDGLCTARHYLVLQVISPDGYSGGAKGKVNQMFILAIDAKKKQLSVYK